MIQGGAPLEGEIAVSGAKNSALPALAACLLTADRVTLDRIPPVRDIPTMQKLLAHIGARDHRERRRGHRRSVATSSIPKPPTNWSKPCALRAWCWVRWWPAAAAPAFRCPADAPSARGPSICTSPAWNNWARQSARSTAISKPKRRTVSKARSFTFDRITVTGTEDLLMAAVLARGETVIDNAAREPEVVDVRRSARQNGRIHRRRRHVHDSRAAASRNCTARLTPSSPTASRPEHF